MRNAVPNASRNNAHARAATRPDPTRPVKTFCSPKSQTQDFRTARAAIGLDR